MFIFDCNGVLVDSEAIVANVAATELTRAGFAVSPEIIARFFAGRRPIDMLADIETATQRKLPPNFAIDAGRRHAAAAAGGASRHRPCRARADLAARAEMRGLLRRRSTVSG